MDDEKEIVWQNFLGLLKNRISTVSINSWFKYCKIYKIDDGVEDNKAIKIITIIASSTYIKDALIKRYLETIEELMESILGKNCKIEFILEEELNQKEEKEVTQIEQTTNMQVNTTAPPITTNEIPIESNLIDRYTFDNFVVGDSNRLAHTAALAVAEQPGKLYNPFFIHGKSGLGKTHLMHAIGNYIKKISNKRVLYVTSENFISDFTSMNMNKDANYIKAFKDKYRNIDILMIDDIQFLEKAEKTQNEFFHTFNTLYDMNKQIIISSDRSPDDLKLLEERLRTRFSWGLTVNIYPPDIELKKRLVKNKMMGHAVAALVKEEAIDYIANNSENDVRHIEGAVTRLYAYAAIMSPQKIDLEFANEALRDYLKNSVYMDSNIAKIQKAVADYYKITVEDLKSKRRTANINYPRQVAIYLCRTYTDESFPKIGLEFGNRDHSTIIHACDKIKEDLENNNQLKEIIREIKNNIG
ncbi:MAG TPA: chromosomal replication initiator protein DnaA [Firmicutes bacterium]|nr:chromosomal replication initiator protein DnaA [Bacillota bacterium]